jgi:hypothetical protein
VLLAQYADELKLALAVLVFVGLRPALKLVRHGQNEIVVVHLFRQHVSACVSMRQHKSVYRERASELERERDPIGLVEFVDVSG